MSASQSGDGIEDNNHIPAIFHHPFGLLQSNFADVGMLARWFIESASYHLRVAPTNLTKHFSHFLGPFVNQEDNQVALGVIGLNSLGNF